MVDGRGRLIIIIKPITSSALIRMSISYLMVAENVPLNLNRVCAGIEK